MSAPHRAAVARPEKDMDAAVPAGHVAVRVEDRAGGGSRRFVVRLGHLNHPAFLELLRQAEEEYGFPSASGPIALPCDEDHLRDVLRRVSSEERLRGRSFCCCGPISRGGTARRGDSRPLLQGMAVEKLVW